MFSLKGMTLRKIVIHNKVKYIAQSEQIRERERERERKRDSKPNMIKIYSLPIKKNKKFSKKQ